MYAISFDLNLATLGAIHPKGFTDDRDLGRLFAALNALKALPWFTGAVTDIRAFRVEDWSNVTPQIKGHP